MVSWDESPSHLTVQLMVTSNGIVFKCNARLVSGKTNTGVGNVVMEVLDECAVKRVDVTVDIIGMDVLIAAAITEMKLTLI